MDSALFLEQFGHLAYSPDGVSKLRSMILDLAVRGKLVEQNPDDEPASELAKRSISMLKSLYKAGEIRKPKKLSEITSDEKPHALPNNWVWIRLHDIMQKITDGTHNSPSNANTGDFMYVTAKNIKEDGVLLNNITYVTKEVHENIYSRCNPEYGDILYIKDGATTGICTLNDIKEPFSMLSSVALLKSNNDIDNRFILYVMRSPFFYKNMRADMTGVAITRVTLTKLNKAVIPLPPLAEQKRIVAKVDELMTLCDQLEAEQTHQRQLVERSVKSTFHHLTNAPTKSEAHQYWGYAEEHFSDLFDRVTTIKDLRATILQLAVQGRLVPQNPDDEPASDLLKQIDAEKKRLVKAGEIKKPKKLPVISDDEIPYELPDGWEWVNIEVIANKITDGEHFRPQTTDDGVFFLSAKDVRSHGVVFDNPLYVSIEDAQKFWLRCKPEYNDILMVSRGATVGRSCIVDIDIEFCLLGSVILIKLYSIIFSKFVLYALKSPIIYLSLLSLSGSTAQEAIYLRDIRSALIPLPPLAEQKRIVAKVDELMALCDQLEQEVEQSQYLSGRLFDSIIHHLFED